MFMSWIWPTACLCEACELRMMFRFLKDWKKVKRKRIFCETWTLHEIQIVAFLQIKFHLDGASHLCIVCGCCHDAMRGEYWLQTIWLTKPGVFAVRLFTWKVCCTLSCIIGQKSTWSGRSSDCLSCLFFFWTVFMDKVFGI